MKLVKLILGKHDLNKVAELIYYTDIDMFNFFFKNKIEAIKRIKKLVKLDNNSLGHENIYIVSEDDNQILGLLVYSKGNEIGMKEDYKAFFKALNPLDAIKFVLFDVMDRLVISDLNEDDYYLACVAVDENFRGRGIGTFILERAKELAKYGGCTRVVLDVDLENKGALKFYERFGFNVFNKKSFRWFSGEKGVFNMEYLL